MSPRASRVPTGLTCPSWVRACHRAGSRGRGGRPRSLRAHVSHGLASPCGFPWPHRAHVSLTGSLAAQRNAHGPYGLPQSLQALVVPIGPHSPYRLPRSLRAPAVPICVRVPTGVRVPRGLTCHPRASRGTQGLLRPLWLSQPPHGLGCPRGVLPPPPCPYSPPPPMGSPVPPVSPPGWALQGAGVRGCPGPAAAETAAAASAGEATTGTRPHLAGRRPPPATAPLRPWGAPRRGGTGGGCRGRGHTGMGTPGMGTPGMGTLGLGDTGDGDAGVGNGDTQEWGPPGTGDTGVGDTGATRGGDTGDRGCPGDHRWGTLGLGVLGGANDPALVTPEPRGHCGG